MNLIQNTSDIIPNIDTDSISSNVAKSFDLSKLSDMALSDIIEKFAGGLVDLTLKITVAVIVFYIGKFIVGKIHNVVKAILIRHEVDLTLATFVLSVVKFTLFFILLIIVIGILGIETSSFIALFASAGVAVGMAMSGTLQNFAGGVLILLLKPYKVGDYIEVQGYSGTVKEIQIFFTILNTIDNKAIIIPNGVLSNGTINNFSKETYRRVEWKVSIAYGDDVTVAKNLAMTLMENDTRILNHFIDETSTKEPGIIKQTEKKRGFIYRLFHRSKPIPLSELKNIDKLDLKRKKVVCKPFVALDQLGDSSLILVMRAWTRSSDYWGVYYDINEKIYTEFPKAGLNFPFPQLDVHINKN